MGEKICGKTATVVFQGERHFSLTPFLQMKIPLFLSLFTPVVVAGLLGLGILGSGAQLRDGKKNQVVIKPLGKNWGASTADVKAILNSAIKPLHSQFPDREFPTITVEPKGGPIVLYKRGPEGENRVRLNVNGPFWSQYAYQFSHEFCHILCNYKEGSNWNLWFEEAICEMASLYSLRRMGETWATDAPYPNWTSYRTSLTGYANKLIDGTEIPEDLSKWFQTHREALRKTGTDRPKNRVVAKAMLPIFEAEPKLWGAVAYLNSVPDREVDFLDFLRDWQAAAPKKYWGGIAKVAALFRVKLLGE